MNDTITLIPTCQSNLEDLNTKLLIMTTANEVQTQTITIILISVVCGLLIGLLIMYFIKIKRCLK